MIYFLIIADLLLLIVAFFLFRFMHTVYHNHYLPRYSNKNAMIYYEDEDFQADTLGRYYADFTKSIYSKPHAFDAQGVFYLIAAKQKLYNPTAIAECAIVAYERMKGGRNEEQEVFEKNIQWLEQNLTHLENGTAVWNYQFDWYHEKAPWSSGIAQGIGISAMLRAYQFYKADKYLQYAQRAFAFMNLPKEQGGKLNTSDTYNHWYDEGNRNHHVLNGHIFSLFGIWDLYRVTKSGMYKSCFDKGCNCIKNTIADFDLGFFTKYDNRSPMPANNSYHSIHAVQFRALASIRTDSFFLQYADKFDNYNKSYVSRLRNYLYLLRLSIKQKLFSA